MKKVLFFLIPFWLAPLLAQSTAEEKVLQSVQQMMQNDDGTVIFSELYNDDRFSSEEKAFLGRLYEIFFQIPLFLKSEYESTGEIPTRSHIASGFGITPQSVDLLLMVMESDSRMPTLFERNPLSREIESLQLATIDAFIERRSGEVKVTQWEGQTLPAFELTTFQGEKIGNRDLAEKNLLIYFWFTGCPPCIRIAPNLDYLDRRYSASNFQVIGFNADHVIGVNATDQQREAYLQEHNLSFANAHLDQATWEAFGNVQIFPTLFFVGSDGTIFRHMINYQDRETLESIIKALTQAR
ncbi:MAG: TlpA family protein disulfide reductase [Acidobacteria bacterium]|nr:TlpA family protein disulfide reductase [Acidobacteriota bacterium]